MLCVYSVIRPLKWWLSTQTMHHYCSVRVSVSQNSSHGLIYYSKAGFLICEINKHQVFSRLRLPSFKRSDCRPETLSFSTPPPGKNGDSALSESVHPSVGRAFHCTYQSERASSYFYTDRSTPELFLPASNVPVGKITCSCTKVSCVIATCRPLTANQTGWISV